MSARGSSLVSGQRIHAAAHTGCKVLSIWPDWLRRWPTASATAAASAADVLRAWGKLGYPRRAKRLRECATVIAGDHGDEVPDDVDTLLTPARCLEAVSWHRGFFH